MDSVYTYEMNSSSLEFLRKIESASGGLACRDWYTVRLLRHYGFKTVMTGCPAMYDMDYLEQERLKEINKVERICISDCANLANLNTARKLVEFCRTKFATAEIYYIFHRGGFDEVECDRGNIRKKALEKCFADNDIRTLDISGSYEGLEIYDSCQLHIGFRVHAHIYNLSHRNRSILLEEDGRGTGINDALGLRGIKLYDVSLRRPESNIQKAKNRFLPNCFVYENKFAVVEVKELLERLWETNGIEYEQAFFRMLTYYHTMIRHIKQNIS